MLVLVYYSVLETQTYTLLAEFPFVGDFLDFPSDGKCSVSELGFPRMSSSVTEQLFVLCSKVLVRKMLKELF